MIARFLGLALAWLIALAAGMLTAGSVTDLTSRQRTPPSSPAVLALPMLLLVAGGLTFARRLFPPVRHADHVAPGSEPDKRGPRSRARGSTSL
ncbi:MAG: hypothetical protein DPW13_04610 [Planctomycetes bacterium]|nr:hypothetical protein [Planctomycetota bacterium]